MSGQVPAPHLPLIAPSWCQDCRRSVLSPAAGHRWLRRAGCPWDSGTCSGAAGGGHLHLLQWCRGASCDWNAGTCSAAAAGGHLQVLQWCRQHGCVKRPATCDESCSSVVLSSFIVD